ncbi:MAG: polysaccharide deacetylase family protein [Ferruginibacter sp.]
MLLLLITSLNIYVGIPVWLYALTLVVYCSIIFYGCYFIRANFFLHVICEGTTLKKEIAISFDDGPANKYTSETLQVLHDHGIEAAFFCIGKRIGGNEKLFEHIHKEGHLIGNHSYSHHIWFDLFSHKKMLEDMRLMDREMEKVIGLSPKLFRPPYGVTNPNLKRAITDGHYIPVGWSVRSMDTVINNEKQLFNKVCRSLKPGAIFLFHDTSKTTLSILPAFIRWVKESGYEIVRLDKMLHLKPYA